MIKENLTGAQRGQGKARLKGTDSAVWQILIFYILWQTLILSLLRYKEETDSAELDIVVEKEEEDLDVKMLRSAKVNHDQDSN